MRTYGIGMKATAQNPMIELPHAIPRSLNLFISVTPQIHLIARVVGRVMDMDRQ